MTGADHYKRAEELLDAVSAAAGRVDCMVSQEKAETALAVAPVVANVLAQAQAHATLALAAAAAYPAITDYCGDEANDSRDWTRVTS